jgi:hypothetical protein
MTAWTDEIRRVAAKNKITYKAAMTVAASSWTKGKTAKAAKAVKTAVAPKVKAKKTEMPPETKQADPPPVSRHSD